MKTNLRLIVIAMSFALFFAVPVRAADERPTFDVWPAKPPGETGKVGEERIDEKARGQNEKIHLLTNVTRPTITIFRPAKEKETGAAVVICPGGGYSILAWDLEGTEVAEWLNKFGVTGIVLKYRVPKRAGQPQHLLPLQDAQRAMSLVRSRAAEWGVDPKRIGILGFSAGGNLCAFACTNYDKRAYETIDEIDKVSCRPDFGVLVYPAWLVQKDREELDPELRVTAQTPPMFLVHAGNDGITAANSAMMYLALKRAGVPAELHVYTTGGHGFGLRPTTRPCSTWPDRCEEWMRNQKFLGSDVNR